MGSECEVTQVYSHIYRKKSRRELILLSGAVCGIEFCYAAETAFVTPTLLSLGLNIKFMTMIWSLSPIIGFFLTPLLGSMSDSCRCKYGRRRPFIVILSIGILAGLILVPNGHSIGVALGDQPLLNHNVSNFYDNNLSMKRVTSTLESHVITRNSMFTSTSIHLGKESLNKTYPQMDASTDLKNYKSTSINYNNSQSWSILFTVIGTVLLDFCSDACQSPSRTYLLDVTVPVDHGTGLSTFTMMAGFGGSIGYSMGGINWDVTFLGTVFGGHVRAVFVIVTILFIICLLSTICSFPEIPLDLLLSTKKSTNDDHSNGTVGNYEQLKNESSEDTGINCTKKTNYKSTFEMDELSVSQDQDEDKKMSLPLTMDQPTLKQYLFSIVYMPKSLRILCLTNLFCWMSLVCYSLYFTDFVGEYVYLGDPSAPEGSEKFQLYEEGVRFACWGMALYSISCSFYSYFIEVLVKKLGAKPVYVGGQLIYSLGMILMAVCRHPVAVILLSPTAGVMYATLFTMPYLLIAHYHCMQEFQGEVKDKTPIVRGIGTDVATVSSMVFVSQFILSLTMGSIIALMGSSVATVCAASVLSACGAVCAMKVYYLDL